MTATIPRAVLVDLIEQFEKEAERLDEEAEWEDAHGSEFESTLCSGRATGIRTVTTGLRAMLNLDRADKARKEG